MISLFLQCGKRFLATFFIITTFSFSYDNFVLKNNNVISARTVTKINQMGSELFQKTGIPVFVLAIQSLDGENFYEYIKHNYPQEMKSKSYVWFYISQKDQVVDILSSQEEQKMFDKKQILSPYPWSGSVLPLLGEKNNGDKFSAAMLNGYADIVEQIASSKGIILDSAIGNTNRITLNIIRVGVYSFLFIAVIIYIYRKVKFGKARKNSKVKD